MRSGRPGAPKRSAKPVGARKVYKKKSVAKRPAKRIASSKIVVRQQNQGQQTQSSELILPYRPDPRARFMKAVVVPQFYETTSANRIDVPNPGIQGWSYAFLANQATLANIGLTNQNNQGLVNNPAVGRFLLESASTEMNFSNFSTAPCHLRIYTVSTRRDTWYSPASPTDRMQFANSLGTKYYWDGDPISAIQEGLNAGTNFAPGTTTALENPAATPMQSSIFKQYFKIVKQQEIFLAQGGNHCFKLTRKYDKVVDGSITQNTSLIGLAGITEFIVYSVVGGVGAKADTSVTFSQAHLGVIQTQKYRSSNCLGNLSNYTTGNNISQTGPVDIVNPGSGGTGVVVNV